MLSAPRSNLAAQSTVRPERRDVGRRPRNGDVKPCPSCGATSEFNERYRLEGRVVPAWLCDRAACAPKPVRGDRPTQSAAM